MALQPVPAQHDVVMQDQSTGLVDFLKFNGDQLVASFIKDYGIAGWKVVANADFNGDGHPDLVVQSQTTGQLDFLFLDASANLTMTNMTPQSFPAVHGCGYFGGVLPPWLVSQLPNGEIDFLKFDAQGTLNATDLVANTIGLPPVVGVMGSGDQTNPFAPAFSGVSSDESNANVVVQNADGSIDILGFSPQYNPAASETMTSSFLLPGSAGSPTLFALDQDASFRSTDSNIWDSNTGLQTAEMVGATASGQIDHLFFASGYHDASHEGAEIGTLLENYSVPTGWQIVDGGMVAHTDIFPLA